jgi:putative flippase GtrA
MSKSQAEMRLFARATLASVVATVVDLLVYEAVLFWGHNEGRLYVVAAVLAAIAGAVTNFLLGRYWAFKRTERSVATQAALYALASFLTYLALQATLALLVEVAHVDARLAWAPAKVVAWLAVSYPMARFVVFGGERGPGR